MGEVEECRIYIPRWGMLFLMSIAAIGVALGFADSQRSDCVELHTYCAAHSAAPDVLFSDPLCL